MTTVGNESRISNIARGGDVYESEDMKRTFEQIAGSRGGGTEQPLTRDATFLTTAELAARWHRHEETIRRMLRENRLACMIIGRRKLIPLSTILAFENAATIGAN